MVTRLITRPWSRGKLKMMTLLLGSLAVALAAGCSAATTPRAAAGIILASHRSSLDQAFPLDGKRVNGQLHVFVAEPETGLEFVDFYVEDAAGEQVWIRRDHSAPYTSTPNGEPLQLDELGEGMHAMVAELRGREGTTTIARADFEVAADAEVPAPPYDTGAKPPIPPAPTPPAPTPPAPPPAPPLAPDGTIWQPQPGTSWQWQLSGKLDLSVAADVYDIDLEGTPTAVIAQLQAAGRRVICYFSAGSFEPWRPDASRFPAAVKGKKMDGWDELWLDIRNIDALAPVMLARLDLAVAKGCDAVEPDNVDGYANDTGFSLRGSDQLAYNRWLANAAHERGLAIALKNDLAQVNDLVDYFDFAINEECFSWNECELLTPFVEAGKAVFGAEYDLAASAFCSKAIALDLDFILKDLNLGVSRYSCR